MWALQQRCTATAHNLQCPRDGLGWRSHETLKQGAIVANRKQASDLLLLRGELISGVAAAQGVANRDMKLENLLLDRDGSDGSRPLLKICDFGYSKVCAARTHAATHGRHGSALCDAAAGACFGADARCADHEGLGSGMTHLWALALLLR